MALAGCREASLSDMRPMLNSDGLMCWLTVNFKKVPKGADPKDVKVVFNSLVLFKDEEFTWDHLAENDYLEKTEKDWLGEHVKYVLDDSTTAADDPPLRPVQFKFQLPSKDSVKATRTNEVVLEATLYWGGRKMDSSTRGLFLAYQSSPTGR